jgi:prevent-host-death family protein
MESLVNIHEAKTHFSRLLARVAAGEEIVIARAGIPVARLVAVSRPKGPRTAGSARGQLTLPDDWDAPLPASVLDSFET